MQTPILETKRLRLRPFAADDAVAVFAGWEQDDAVSRYMLWSSHHDFAKAGISNRTGNFVSVWRWQSPAGRMAVQADF